MDKNQQPESVFVCGAGHQGLSMAAHLALNGVNVTLWNRTFEHIRGIAETGMINCSGVVDGKARIEKASDRIEEVIQKNIMVTAPSSAHKDIARTLAPYVSKDMTIILNPGRTFGAVEFAEELKRCNVCELPRIAETQTILYTCRKTGPDSVCIYALKNDVQLSVLKGFDIGEILNAVPKCIRPYFIPVESSAVTSFSNIGMILHCAPVLMNIGWIESDKVDFKYYYDGISKSVAGFLEKLDAQRMAVAKEAGFPVESLTDWLRRTYLVRGNNIYECIRNNAAYREIDAPPTLNTRYLFEDIPNGLVPIEFLGKELGVNVHDITTTIDLADSILNKDHRAVGRLFGMELLKEYF